MPPMCTRRCDQLTESRSDFRTHITAMNMQRDFAGNTVAAGDTIAVSELDRKSLKRYKVLRITEHGVHAEPEGAAGTAYERSLAARMFATDQFVKMEVK